MRTTVIQFLISALVLAGIVAAYLHGVQQQTSAHCLASKSVRVGAC